MLKKYNIIALAILISLSTLNANQQATAKDKEEDSEKETPAQDYYRAMYKYANGKFEESSKAFEDIEIKYPTLSYIKKVKIMLIYTKYLDRDYEFTKVLIQDFLQLYPSSEYDEYLSYLDALCDYRQITGIDKAFDAQLKTKAEMLNTALKYPNSKYGKDAKQKYEYLTKIISFNNYIAGNTYQKDRSYFAAIKRYLDLVHDQQSKNQINLLPIAYYRLYECYRDIGIEDMSKKYKSLFNSIMVDFQGDTSFSIIGVLIYNAKDKKVQGDTKEDRRAIRKAKKIERKNKQKQS
ncbi:outer membrane protein assembly factor BamD [Rickettsiales bacterium]|nr:outer membrane protein assembly factor BamD [Rickettsiales bacterium]